MEREQTVLMDGCPKCGSHGATIHCCPESTVVESIICDSCGGDLR
jgi:hypothetical protein